MKEIEQIDTGTDRVVEMDSVVENGQHVVESNSNKESANEDPSDSSADIFDSKYL